MMSSFPVDGQVCIPGKVSTAVDPLVTLNSRHGDVAVPPRLSVEKAYRNLPQAYIKPCCGFSLTRSCRNQRHFYCTPYRMAL